jgi:hypothetical protein
MRTFHSKTFLLLLSALIIQICSAASVVEPAVIGEWSQPTNNLRGRLLFAEYAKTKGGTRIGAVYLELQNLSLSETLSVYYDAKKSPLRCDLTDSAGISVKSVFGGRDFVPEACWVALPRDSTLRFSASFGPAFGPASSSLTFAVGIEQTWVIPLSATNDYSLLGTFTVASPKEETREHVWQGTLKLPAVRISVKAP